MAQEEAIKLFGAKQIRVVWDNETEKYYFSVVDIIQVLTESADYQTARNYWKVLKNRLSKEGNESVTNCNQLKLQVADAARQNLEKRIGRSVISSRKAVNFTTPADELPLPKDKDDLDEIESIEE